MPSRVRAFWERVSDGIGIEQLWAQFHADARASYQLYSQEVDWTRQEGEPAPKRWFRVSRGLFWAMLMKLSPGRRVLLLAALVFLVLQGPNFRYGEIEIQFPNLSLLSIVALLALLALELADRVTLKRDLEIAREIQNWLMPSEPPHVPGVDIAFATRPANTVAGDYYDAFFRQERLLLVVADVARLEGKAKTLMRAISNIDDAMMR